MGRSGAKHSKKRSRSVSSSSSSSYSSASSSASSSYSSASSASSEPKKRQKKRPHEKKPSKDSKARREKKSSKASKKGSKKVAEKQNEEKNEATNDSGVAPPPKKGIRAESDATTTGRSNAAPPKGEEAPPTKGEQRKVKEEKHNQKYVMLNEKGAARCSSENVIFLEPKFAQSPGAAKAVDYAGATDSVDKSGTGIGELYKFAVPYPPKTDRQFLLAPAVDHEMRRVFVGGLNRRATEKDVAAVMSAFGPIETVEMKPGQGKEANRGFCFVDYMGPSSAAFAMDEPPNSVKILGQTVRLARTAMFDKTLKGFHDAAVEEPKNSTPPPPSRPVATAPPPLPREPPVSTTKGASSSSACAVTEDTNRLQAPAVAPDPSSGSKLVCIENFLAPGEELTQEVYDDLLNHLSGFGSFVAPLHMFSLDEDGCVRGAAQFGDEKDAADCITALNGKAFANRVLTASPLDPEVFQMIVSQAA